MMDWLEIGLDLKFKSLIAWRIFARHKRKVSFFTTILKFGSKELDLNYNEIFRCSSDDFKMTLIEIRWITIYTYVIEDLRHSVNKREF